MPNPQTCYYVNRDGSYGAATHPPEDSLPIGLEQYQLIQENPGLIDIRVEGSVIHITPSLISYKNATKANLRTIITNNMPSQMRLANLFRAACMHTGCFDEETGKLLDAEETAETAEALHLRYNDLLYLQHKYIAKVDAATDPTEIDRIFDTFERTMQGTL
ncbi:hypothetical protein D3C85_838840 [compost metagenome]